MHMHDSVICICLKSNNYGKS